ncbi:hypothetical protein BN2537_571 [Streptomyces venezuelae]|nr:hypothetical protein BN2537_571 [Streptomyces venezuelae]
MTTGRLGTAAGLKNLRAEQPGHLTTPKTTAAISTDKQRRKTAVIKAVGPRLRDQARPVP